MSTSTDRLPDWPSALAACIREQQQRPPRWGTDDCLTWTARCVEAMTGTDPLAAVRGTYSTPAGAARVLRRVFGVERPVDLMDRLWGPRLHISQARMGDVVVVRLPEHDGELMDLAAGVCYGRRSFFVGSDGDRHGLVALDTLSLEHCYRI